MKQQLLRHIEFLDQSARISRENLIRGGKVSRERLIQGGKIPNPEVLNLEEEKMGNRVDEKATTNEAKAPSARNVALVVDGPTLAICAVI